MRYTIGISRISSFLTFTSFIGARATPFFQGCASVATFPLPARHLLFPLTTLDIGSSRLPRKLRTPLRPFPTYRSRGRISFRSLSNLASRFFFFLCCPVWQRPSRCLSPPRPCATHPPIGPHRCSVPPTRLPSPTLVAHLSGPHRCCATLPS